MAVFKGGWASAKTGDSPVIGLSFLHIKRVLIQSGSWPEAVELKCAAEETEGRGVHFRPPWCREMQRCGPWKSKGPGEEKKGWQEGQRPEPSAGECAPGKDPDGGGRTGLFPREMPHYLLWCNRGTCQTFTANSAKRNSLVYVVDRES